jgi:hypothetical protein
MPGDCRAAFGRLWRPPSCQCRAHLVERAIAALLQFTHFPLQLGGRGAAAAQSALYLPQPLLGFAQLALEHPPARELGLDRQHVTPLFGSTREPVATEYAPVFAFP